MSSLTTAVAQHFLRLEVQSWPCLFHTKWDINLPPRCYASQDPLQQSGNTQQLCFEFLPPAEPWGPDTSFCCASLELLCCPRSPAEVRTPQATFLWLFHCFKTESVVRNLTVSVFRWGRPWRLLLRLLPETAEQKICPLLLHGGSSMHQSCSHVSKIVHIYSYYYFFFLHYFKLNTPLFPIWSYCIWLYNNDYVFFTFLVWCPWRVVTSALIPDCSGSTTSWSGLMRAPSRAADFLFTACLTLLCLLLWLLCVYHHSWSHYKRKKYYFF